MMVTAFRNECLSCMPQNREVSTEAPMPMPMQQIWKMLMNWFAREDAERAVSPSLPSMMVSVMFTPMVIRLWAEIGRAMAATRL